jgi:peptidoglycan hydrolase-like protein with peptidoglycan-binding domain
MTFERSFAGYRLLMETEEIVRPGQTRTARLQPLNVGVLFIVCVLMFASCGSKDAGSATNSAGTEAVGVGTSSSVSTTSVSPKCEPNGVDPSEASRLRWPPLKQGDDSSRVLVFQFLLRANSFAVDADGKFGTATEAAMQKLAPTTQNQTLETTVTPQMWLRLLSDCDVGSSPDRVKAFQSALQIPGYKQSVTGVLDDATQANLALSRIDSGSVATGVVNIADWLTLVGVGD